MINEDESKHTKEMKVCHKIEMSYFKKKFEYIGEKNIDQLINSESSTSNAKLEVEKNNCA